MKKKLFKKVLTLAVAGAMVVGMTVPAMATETTDKYENTVIDPDAKGSITIYKYDTTSASTDGVYDETQYTNGTGEASSTFESMMSDYAMEGITFMYLKVGTVYQYEFEDQRDTDSDGKNDVDEIEDELLYSVDSWLETLLKNTTYVSEDVVLGTPVMQVGSTDYYTSDQIEAAFQSLISTIKGQDALYDHVTTDDSAVAMTATDVNGYTSTGFTTNDNGETEGTLDQALYLVVETKVSPEVTTTTAPFLVAIPMTNSTGTGWLYDITVYPKNQTDTELEPDKEVKVSTSDEYGDSVSATTGDKLDYSIGMEIGTITTASTYYTDITITDEMSTGYTINTSTIKISFYASENDYDHGNGTALFTWGALNGNGTNNYYSFTNNNDGTYTISVTKGTDTTTGGLDEINYNCSKLYSYKDDEDNTVYGDNYSGLYMVVTYQVYVDFTSNDTSDAASLNYGDQGNVNTATVTWKRTNGDENKHDDATIVFYYGIDLTKIFSPNNFDADTNPYASVKFTLQKQEVVTVTENGEENPDSTSTTTVYLTAIETSSGSGVWYITGETTDSTEATEFTPGSDGKLVIYGVDGSYTATDTAKTVTSHDITLILTEVATYKGYNLLDEPVEIVITTASAEYTAGYYDYQTGTDNKDYYDSESGENKATTWVDGYWTLTSAGSASVTTKHTTGTDTVITATWDTKSLSGDEDTYGASSATSYNVSVLLEINNTKGFSLPITGGMGTMLVVIIGAVIICLAVVVGNRSKKRKAA